jgi:Reverse transcriptase (RNA-dependent DNA polymerase)
MESCDGRRDEGSREEWNLRDDRSAQRVQINWSQVGVQEENDPTRHNWEAQGETHSQKISAEGRDRLWGGVYPSSMNRDNSTIDLAGCAEWMVGTSDGCELSFLNGVLEDKVYVEQPLRYMKLGKEHKVLKLKKALYGLKQASRARNTRIDNYFKKNGFKRCPFAAAIYVKVRKDELLIITLYVDDLIFIGNSQRLIDEFKWEMKLEFEMKDFRMMRYFSLEIKQQKSGIFISQGAYAWEIL